MVKDKNLKIHLALETMKQALWYYGWIGTFSMVSDVNWGRQDVTFLIITGQVIIYSMYIYIVLSCNMRSCLTRTWQSLSSVLMIVNCFSYKKQPTVRWQSWMWETYPSWIMYQILSISHFYGIFIQKIWCRFVSCGHCWWISCPFLPYWDSPFGNVG